MRQGQNNKNRMRGRNSSNNPRKGGGSRNQSYESNGPDVKVRGNAQQVVEKYLTLARDAMLSGDRIDAESYYQFAEHYYRIMNANAANEQQRQQQNPSNDQQGGDNGQNNQNADNGNRGGDQQADADDSPRSGRRGPADKSGDAETDDSAEASESDSEVLEAAATTDDNAGEASRPRRRSSRGGTRRKKNPTRTPKPMMRAVRSRSIQARKSRQPKMPPKMLRKAPESDGNYGHCRQTGAGRPASRRR